MAFLDYFWEPVGNWKLGANLGVWLGNNVFENHQLQIQSKLASFCYQFTNVGARFSCQSWKQMNVRRSKTAALAPDTLWWAGKEGQQERLSGESGECKDVTTLGYRAVGSPFWKNLQLGPQHTKSRLRTRTKCEEPLNVTYLPQSLIETLKDITSGRHRLPCQVYEHIRACNTVLS